MKRRRIAVLTPDPHDDYGARAEQAFAAYAAAFGAHGIDVVASAWTAAPLGDVEVHLALLAWGYHFDQTRWAAVLRDWPPEVRLVNPSALLTWNTDKLYLQDLAHAGVATVPTIFCCADNPVAMAAALAAARARWSADLVIKPRVSAGAYATHRVRAGQPTPEISGHVMVQPFLPSLADEGELSLFYFGGRFSHAVAKRAAAGDFRVQPQFGGVFRSYAPEPQADASARAALAAALQPSTYARVDLVRDREGRLCIIELELIEPDLYIDWSPEGVAGLVEVLFDGSEGLRPQSRMGSTAAAAGTIPEL